VSGMGARLGEVNWRHVIVVARKEFTDTLRDRRTWLAMVILPLIIVPVLLLVAPAAVQSQMDKVDKSVARVAVVGQEGAPQFVAFLGRTAGLSVCGSADPEAELRARKLQAVLRLPPGFDADIAAEHTVQVEIAFDAADQRSVSAHDRLMFAMNAYAASVSEQRLLERGVDPALLRPIATSSRNIAPPARMGGVFLSMVMPMMIALWAVTGGMYAAIDATAGEKERGTMEVLLAAPPSRTSVTIGKFLVVTATALFSATISVAAMVLAFSLRPEALGMMSGGGESVTVALPLRVLALIAVASIGLAGIFAALELAVALFARSFREAQAYLTPLSFLIVFPGIATQFMAAGDAASWVFAVPLLNAIFIYKELLEGTVNWSHLGLVLITSAALALVCLRATVGLFGREEVVFRA
jgi:sodium transport system permease protein